MKNGGKRSEAAYPALLRAEPRGVRSGCLGVFMRPVLLYSRRVYAPIFLFCVRSAQCSLSGFSSVLQKAQFAATSVKPAFTNSGFPLMAALPAEPVNLFCAPEWQILRF